MTKQSISTRPPNSIIFVADSRGGKLPDGLESLVTSTPSCLVIGCKMEQDGPTTIVIGDSREIDPGYRPAFSGILETPSRKIAVTLVPKKKVLEMAVPTVRTHIRVWANHSSEPDHVTIGVD
jgi:hypothetical protein